MQNNNARVRTICYQALIAALYVALTFAVPMLSFGMMQLRLSEAMTVLPVLYPPATLGLTVGCALANLIGFFSGVNPIGLIDAPVGALATLLAGLCSAAVGKLIPAEKHPHRRMLLGLIFPAVFNGVIVGAELTALFLESFWVNCFWVAAGELVVCYVLGYPLGLGLQRSSIFRRLLHTEEKQ